jgi:hypothetical protein
MVERRRLQPQSRRDPTPTLAEYEEGLPIDEHSLHSDCRNQPEFFYHIARAVGEARGEYESAKIALKRIQSEVELAVRQDAEAGEIRMTEGRCAAEVASNETVKAAADLVSQCNARVERLQALKEAYVHRKDMLKELVQLYISKYYSDPVRGAESRLRDVAVEGVRAARRRDRENNNTS